MVVTGAIAAVVGAGYGIYAGERGASEGRDAVRRQKKAQQQAMGQKTATAARSRGREAQSRIGKQLAIANQARVGRKPGAMPSPAAANNPAADAAPGIDTFG